MKSSKREHLKKYKTKCVIYFYLLLRNIPLYKLPIYTFIYSVIILTRRMFAGFYMPHASHSLL